jgi:hypothetical protein
MKHMFKLIALAAFIPVAVLAQGASLDEEVNAELDRMYNEQPAAQNARAGGANVQVNVGQSVEQRSAQVSQQTQKQPLTVIEATPIAESRADRMRKSRQEQEIATEQKIVEKLELSRLEDERRRSEVLFGDRFNNLMQQNTQQQATVTPAVVGDNNNVAVTTQQTAAPIAVIAEPVKVDKEEKAELDREAIRGEVSAALAEMKPREEEKAKDSSYFSGIIGSADYPDAKNVRGQYTLGVAYGKKFADRTVVEGSYLYSNFQVEQRDGGCFFDPYIGTTSCYPRITEMNQHQTSLLAKYQLLGGTFRPEVGAVASYTFRSYTDTQFALSSDSVSSQAFDVGFMTGVSLELSQSFSLGFDFRYMQNLSNKVDSQFQKSYVQPYLKSDKPVERLNYYTMGLVLRSTF